MYLKKKCVLNLLLFLQFFYCFVKKKIVRVKGAKSNTKYIIVKVKVAKSDTKYIIVRVKVSHT